MTQEEKSLLLKELCARLPYGVKFQYIICDFCEPDVLEDVDVKREQIITEEVSRYDIEEIKPYLRPMSSMTEEEREHLQSLHDIISDENYGDGYSPAAWDTISEFNDYCHAHHLDNIGLVGKGLALEAPEGMY